MTAAIDITAGQRKTLLALLRRYIPGVAVWAYGSRVKWTARPNSDLDLVAFTTPEQQPLVSELKEALAESDLPFLVDFHVWDDVPERFHEIIRKEYVVLQEAEEKQSAGDAASDWRSASIQEVSEKVAMGPFGSSIKVDTFVPQGVPVISGQHLRGTRLTDLDYNFISLEHADKLANANVKRGDVVFTHAGNIGQVAYIPESSKYERYVISQRQFYLRPNTQKALPEFIAYYFTSADGQHKLLANASSSGVPSIAQPVTYLRTIKIPVPPLPEQKGIAHILGTLDDKIELNRRMNATLETMARALFQSWFVDFDLVRAKLDGRQPTSLDAATAKFFPATFQDSEAGHIPKGWAVGKVSDLAILNRGAVNPGDFPAETFDHFSLPAFDNDRTPKVELGSAIMSNKLTVTPNSVLLSKLNPHIPRIWLPDLHPSRRSICSTEFMVACSKPDVTREYLFSLFTSSAFASVYGTLVTGTTGSHQRIRPESVLDMKIVIPSIALIRAYTDIAKPMFDRINHNTEQSRTLAALRDALLSKLLSGELSVKDNEQFCEVA